jgi:hypothetical protein
MHPHNLQLTVTVEFEVSENPNLKRFDKLYGSDGTQWIVDHVEEKHLPPLVLANPPPPAYDYWLVRLTLVDPRGTLQDGGIDADEIQQFTKME